MAGNEATIYSSMVIKKGELHYPRCKPASFRATVTGEGGPTPGAVEISTSGAEVDLGALSTPGLCRLQNLDDENYVTYGILDSDGNTFHELGELLAGESFVLRLSRLIGDGEGTDYESLFMKANTATCWVLVEAFEV